MVYEYKSEERVLFGNKKLRGGMLLFRNGTSGLDGNLI